MKKCVSGLALTLLAGTASAQVFVGVNNSATGVHNYDPTMGVFREPTIAAGNAVKGLAADDVNDILYVSTGTQLFKIPYAAPRTPVFVGSFLLGATAVGIPGGLAYDSAAGVLYGTGLTSATSTTGSRLYSINTTTAALTLVRNFTSPDFSGLDYNPANNKLYATNDATSTANGFSGRGIYTLDLPVTAVSAFAKIADYPIKTLPSTLETEIEGLAVGGGRVYLCTDDDTYMYIYDLNDGVYLPNVTQTFLTVDEGDSGATYSAELAFKANFDIYATMTGPADCSMSTAGDTGTFVFTVYNPSAAGVTNVSVAFNVPASAGTVTSVPSGSQVGNVLTVNLGSIAPSSSAVLTVEMTATTAGAFAASATATAAEADPVGADNSANASTVVFTAPATTATIKSVFSTIVGNSSSDVPGFPGLHYQNTAGLDAPRRNLAGTMWIMGIDTDNPDFTYDEMLIVHDGTDISVVMEGGTTPVPTSPGGSVVSLMDPNGYSINDSGHWAISGSDDRTGTTDDDFIVKWNGTNLELIAQELTTAVPVSLGSGTFDTPGTASIANDGTVAFQAALLGLPVTSPTSDSGIFKASMASGVGAVVVAQEGITTPTGAPSTWQVFDGGTISLGFFTNAVGDRYLATGDTFDATTEDDVLVVDGVVVVREGIAFGPYVSPAQASTPVEYAFMLPNGDWHAYGGNNDGHDWVLKNGTVIAETDDSIDGSAETWTDDDVDGGGPGTAYANTFFSVTGNNAGDYVIGGVTSSTNLLSNAAVVLNGTTVLARENDPVDLDGNGTFDEDVYIQTFNDDKVMLMEDVLYMVVALRSGGSASGCAADATVGNALLRIALPTGPTCGSADFDGDGDTGTDLDIEAFFACLGGDCCALCGSADFDGDGDTGTDLDIEAFFRVLGGGDC